MKKLIYLTLTILCLNSCGVPSVEGPFIVSEIGNNIEQSRYNEIFKKKYRFTLKNMKYQTVYFYTDSLYQVGDTIK